MSMPKLKGYWNLKITEKQFDRIYHGLEVDKDVFKVAPSKMDKKAYDTASLSKLWRLNNWYKVVDKVGTLVHYKMKYAQHVVHARQLRHGRSIILKSRQRGISTHFLVTYFDDAITLPNLSVGMQSYGLEESTALLGKLAVAWDNLSDYNKNVLLKIDLVKNNTKAMSFTNGSEVKVATSFRGTTLHRLHVSELGKIANKDPKKAEELKTGTLQAIKAGNPVAIESTAEGQHNAFHEWWWVAVDLTGERSLKDFDPIFLSWIDDPDCVADIEQSVSVEDALEIDTIEAEWSEYANEPGFKLLESQRWWFVGARRELGDKFYQEYPHTPESAFAAVHDGSYYARLWRDTGHVWDNKEKGRGLYDSALEVHTAWDLGRNDMMVIVFFQVFGGDYRVIDEYHNHGESLEHYYGVLKSKRAKYGYHYHRHILPHDAKVTDLSVDVDRKQVLSDLGMKGIKVLRKTKSVNNDIEQVRKAIPHIYVCKEKANYIIKMFGRYSKKWDDILGTFKDKPLHNEWSNPADSVRYMVMSKMINVETSYERSQASSDDGSSSRGSNVVDGMAL